MAPITPSFVAKVARARQHIADLQDALNAYAAPHPFAVTEAVEGQGKQKRTVRRLQFTADPANTPVPVIAADVIYNLRSSLDHLQNSIVPKRRRGHVFFPIYFEGVWEAPAQEENEQRTKQRGRWLSDTKMLADDAVAILKSLQPPDGTLPDDEINLLAAINTLSNTDRHTKIPVLSAGLTTIVLQWKAADDSSTVGVGRPDPGRFIENHAEVRNLPTDAADVEIQGTPVIVTPIGDDGGNVQIPGDLIKTATLIEKRIIPALSPFVQ